MATERDLGLRMIPLSEMRWFFPAEAMQKLLWLAQECGIDVRGSMARPIPRRHRLDILSRLVRETILGGPLEQLPQRSAQLSVRDREYLQRSLQEALEELLRLEIQAPSTPLGVPPEPEQVWGCLIDCIWLPMPSNATYGKHS
ncbi:MAG TPA: hypothetical protein VG960_07960 [Caulobacteraceae bacterium]|nr:hypothetical protein [Caulobacteraceae bacterium]